MATRLFGLIGFPLTHSFSKKYFAQKIQQEAIDDVSYEQFEIDQPDKLLEVIAENPNLRGVNVTIPHKQAVISLLDEINDEAKRIGAVNVIKIKDGRLVGYNSDYFGFKESLSAWLINRDIKALILGTGGASKAVHVALQDLGIPCRFVSRTSQENHFTYEELLNQPELIKEFRLIINTTPLGTSPNTEDCPAIPYESLSSDHYLYDLVYNPSVTKFMSQGKDRGAKVKNGYEMLVLQAEKSWEIWNA